MATLNEIENFLQIEIGDKRLRAGKKYEDKNKYYYYNELYYIVELTQGKWMICSDNRETRRLLRDYCWRFHQQGYAQTKIDRTTKCYHQIYLNYEVGLVADHTNRLKYDNRYENLRVVTVRENNQNLSKKSNNTSGSTGVNRMISKGLSYWEAQIRDNDSNRVRKAFSINKLGDDEAKRQAIEQRLAWEVQYGYIGE
jgi:hypothetical protein